MQAVQTAGLQHLVDDHSKLTLAPSESMIESSCTSFQLRYSLTGSTRIELGGLAMVLFVTMRLLLQAISELHFQRGVGKGAT